MLHRKKKKVAGERGYTGLAVEVTVAGLIRRLEFVYSSGGQNHAFSFWREEVHELLSAISLRRSNLIEK